MTSPVSSASKTEDALLTPEGGPPFGLLGKAIEGLSTLAGYLSLLAILCAMASIAYEVVSRYFFGAPTVWEVEASIFFTIFATFVGSAFALKENAHISMDVFTVYLAPRARARLDLATAVLGLFFCAVVTVKGFEMWLEAFRLGWRSDSLWAPPLAIPYAFLPVGFLLMSLQYVVNIAKQLRGLRRRVQP